MNNALKSQYEQVFIVSSWIYRFRAVGGYYTRSPRRFYYTHCDISSLLAFLCNRFFHSNLKCLILFPFLPSSLSLWNIRCLRSFITGPDPLNSIRGSQPEQNVEVYVAHLTSVFSASLTYLLPILSWWSIFFHVCKGLWNPVFGMDSLVKRKQRKRIMGLFFM